MTTNYPNYPFSIEKPDSNQRPNILDFYVISNAPINVERISKQEPNHEHTYENIQEIAKFLRDSQGTAEIVINIHGYNSKESGVREGYKKIASYISSDNYINRKNIVFIGYRWPSEYFLGSGDNESESFKKIFNESITGLPVLFKTILISTLFLLLLIVLPIGIFLIFSSSIPKLLAFFISLLFGLLTFSLGTVFSIIFFRVTVYFRDAYRATNYGVPDLVELIRQLDYAIVENSPKDNRESKKIYWRNKKIKLSFIGHSMGAFVTTNVVRILSDIFDESSIEQPHEDDNKKQPSPDIGNVFSLGRLVLVSPDIPIETIIPGRANFLRSSLRRFEESYLFSNEGDIILRVASTATNYLSFPAISYDRGFRLGNVIVDSYQNGSFGYENKRYGIINLQQEDGYVVNYDSEEVMRSICIVSDEKLKSIKEISDEKLRLKLKLMLRQGIIESPNTAKQEPIAALFTYFNCTDYKENGKGVVSRALGKEQLNFWDGFVLIIDYLTSKIDVHGGYFDGKLSKEMIYGLAFLGFKEFLQSLEQQHNDNLDDSQLSASVESTFNSEDFRASLSRQGAESDEEKEQMMKLYILFSKITEQKYMQVFLSPERYQVDILGKERDRTDY
ncbi:MAG: hypothetical protein ACHBN1_13215 [Heteroscytonema crispum UTEX LB 1556]